MLDVTFEALRNGVRERQNQTCQAIVKVSSLYEGDGDFPIHLAIVIDKSGSMRGAKFQAAKDAASGLLQQLSKNDSASVTLYREDILALGQARGDEQENIRSLLTKLETEGTGGTTNLHKGWLEGASTIASNTSSRSASRVLLLTDGMANEGITDEGTILSQVSALADRGISTSTIGIGEGFNETLLTQIAAYGQGNSYYGEEAEDLLDGYQEEFQALKHSSALNITLHVKPMRHVKLEIKNQYVKANGGWKLPHLSNGGEIQSLFDFWIDSEAIDGKQTVAIARAFVTYQDLDGEMHRSDVAWLKLDILPNEAFEALNENVNVKKRNQELEVAALRRRLQTAAYNRDWTVAERLLRKAKRVAEGDEWLTQSLSALENLIAKRNSSFVGKEAWYMADKLNKRQVAKDETAKYDTFEESEKAAYLRRKMSQGKRFI